MDYSRFSSLVFDDDDEWVAAMTHLAVRRESIARDAALFRKRWDCDYLRTLAEQEGSFIAEYRVGPAEFDILHTLLEPALRMNNEMARRAMGTSGSDPISTSSRLGIALILLGGGRRTEAMRTHGVSRATCYETLYQVCEAINNCPALDLNCSQDIFTLQRRAADFKARSTHGLFDYCVGAIDGLAIQIRVPSHSETTNQLAFYSGSKDTYCLNFQAVCDANREFIGVSCKCSGSTNDIDAFDVSNLKLLNELLPFPFHWIGDGAYAATETLMPPVPGVNLHITDPAADSFNFWLSQLRINIECAFGMFIQRWGIFWKPLKFKLKNVFSIIQACVRLHNFCIQRRLPIISTDDRAVPSIAMVDEEGRLIADIWRHGAQPTEEWRRNTVGNALRERLVEEIRRRHLFHDRNISR